MRRIETLQNVILRKILQVSWYTRNQVIRDSYNIKTVEDVFQVASSRYASSLGTHPNMEARRLLFQPFVPVRLVRPRYTQQLDTHILPLQRQFQIRPTLEEELPTLLLIEQREQNAVREARELDRLRQLCLQSSGRMSEIVINSLRRRYRDGLISRERVEALIAHQPPQIQNIILPQLRQPGEQQDAPAIWQLQRKVHLPARFDGGRINALRRDFRLGRITREKLEQVIRGQPAQIKELILPSVRAAGGDESVLIQDVPMQQQHALVHLNPVAIPLNRKCNFPLMDENRLCIRPRMDMERLELPQLGQTMQSEVVVQHQSQHSPSNDVLELDVRLGDLRQQLEQDMDDELLLEQQKVTKQPEQFQCRPMESTFFPDQLLSVRTQHHLLMQQFQATSVKRPCSFPLMPSKRLCTHPYRHHIMPRRSNPEKRKIKRALPPAKRMCTCECVDKLPDRTNPCMHVRPSNSILLPWQQQQSLEETLQEQRRRSFSLRKRPLHHLWQDWRRQVLSPWRMRRQCANGVQQFTWVNDRCLIPVWRPLHNSRRLAHRKARPPRIWLSL
ncbi:GH23886 [Drosophila grimshawi]|uniref:GH23886 n=1 Tax=Drosophila grimshawi TaxID=7222 RepID=B4K3D8_DROGR|nr:GH23886 [Drosophila grimshawi]